MMELNQKTLAAIGAIAGYLLTRKPLWALIGGGAGYLGGSRLQEQVVKHLPATVMGYLEEEEEQEPGYEEEWVEEEEPGYEEEWLEEEEGEEEPGYEEEWIEEGEEEPGYEEEWLEEEEGEEEPGYEESYPEYDQEFVDPGYQYQQEYPQQYEEPSYDEGYPTYEEQQPSYAEGYPEFTGEAVPMPSETGTGAGGGGGLSLYVPPASKKAIGAGLRETKKAKAEAEKKAAYVRGMHRLTMEEVKGAKRKEKKREAQVKKLGPKVKAVTSAKSRLTSQARKPTFKSKTPSLREGGVVRGVTVRKPSAAVTPQTTAQRRAVGGGMYQGRGYTQLKATPGEMVEVGTAIRRQAVEQKARELYAASGRPWPPVSMDDKLFWNFCQRQAEGLRQSAERRAWGRS